MPTEHELGGAEAIRARNVAPLVQSVDGSGPSLVTLAQNVLHGFHCGLCEAVTLGVVRGQKFMGNAVLDAKFGEVTAELGALIATNG